LTLEELLPHLEGVTTAKELGRRIIELGVPRKLKFPLASGARDALGFGWTDRTVRDNLSPKAHTEDRADKNRVTSQAAHRAARATPEGRAKANAASRDAQRAILATEEGRAKARAISRATRATPEGRAKVNAASVVSMAKYFEPGGRYYTDPEFRIICLLRSRLRKAISNYRKATGQKTQKQARTLDLIGCTVPELLAHIESQFVESMSWDNRHEWDIDHIRPLAAFERPDDPEAWQLSNLAPLWKPDNYAKGSLWNGERHRYG
jgi:hypothetical protein